MSPSTLRVALMRARLRPASKFVAIRILDLQGLRHGASTISIRTLADDCGVSVAAVEKALQELTRTGWLTVEHVSQRAFRRIAPPDARRESPPDERREVAPRDLPTGVGSQADGNLPTGVGRCGPRTPDERREDPPTDVGGPSRQASGTLPTGVGRLDADTPSIEVKRSIESRSEGPCITEHDLHAAWLQRWSRKYPGREPDGHSYAAQNSPDAQEWRDLLIKVRRQARLSSLLDTRVRDVVLDAFYADSFAEGCDFPPKLLVSKFSRYASDLTGVRRAPDPRRGRSGAVFLDAKPEDYAGDEFGDGDLPPEPGQRVIGYG